MEAAASIAGLVALTDLVFRRTSSFVKHAKGAEGEIKTLQAEIRDLAGILKSLELVLEQFDGESDARCSMRLHLVRSCHETLEKIRTRLQEAAPPNQATNHGKLLKKLKWPYSLSETMELVDQISRHKLTITTALSADSLSQLVNVLGGQENIEKEIVELGDRLQKRWDQEDLIALSETRKKILDTYTKGEPYQQHYASLQLRHPETGRWLLQSHEYVHWSTTANGKLWLYGIPGAGKTVLMSMVIEEAMKHCSPGNAVAYFYCDYKEPETHQPANILSTLASQLARQNEEAMLKLQAYHDTLSTPSRLPKPSTTESLLKLIGEMAIDFNEVAILIDGLDECGDMTESVVGSLVGLENSAATIKTLFASRDEQSIRYQLEDHEKLSVSARTEDLELYVAAEVELRIRKRKLRLNPKSTSLKDYIIETLIHKADGM